MPDEGIRHGQIDRSRRRRGETLQRFCDAIDESGHVIHRAGHFTDCLTKEARKLWSGPPYRKDLRVMNPFSLIQTAYAQDASGNFLASATQFAPLILIFAVFYF